VQPLNTPQGGWPVEQKLQAQFELLRKEGKPLVLQSGEEMRSPMPLSELKARVAEHNTRLARIKGPVLLVDEAIVARLYTVHQPTQTWDDPTRVISSASALFSCGRGRCTSNTMPCYEVWIAMYLLYVMLSPSTAVMFRVRMVSICTPQLYTCSTAA
jgi:hypothetical protein